VALLLPAGAARAQGAGPAQVGEWTPTRAWPTTGTHSILLPTGKVLHFSETEADDLFLWDPETGSHSRAAHPGYNIFCSGHAFMSDGRLFVAGGHYDTDHGRPEASIYDAAADRWQRLPNMNAGRWYPTVAPLANGEVLVLAGTDTEHRLGENRLPQVWQPQSNSWRNLTGAERTLYTYPWMFPMPDGRLFMAGEGSESMMLTTAGTGGWVRGVRSNYARFDATGVMYDEGKVLVLGGGIYAPTHTMDVTDLFEPVPSYRAVQPMAAPRKQHNATLLPDGTVLITGGSSGAGKSDADEAVHHTELWDPVTERLTPLARLPSFRGYHSTALLLPDGRVLSAGGEETQTYEVFSPPYLFKGPRPRVTALPATVQYGTTFRVETPDAAAVTAVTLLAPGAVTHAYNQNQRIKHLHFRRAGGGALEVTAPADPNLAVPGPYMLFVLTEKGVPSVGRFLKLQGGKAEVPAPTPVVSAQSTWLYHDGAGAPGEGWQGASYDDLSWRSGAGPFDSAEAEGGTRLSLPPGQPGAYLRQRFALQGAVHGGELEVRFEDGVAVFLNGRQVLARNVGHGLEPAAWASASAASGGSVARVRLPPALFRDGPNQLAVVLKRVKPADPQASPRVRFEMSLSVRVQGGGVSPAPRLVLTAPNGGERLAAGSTVAVTWKSEGSLGRVKLELSADGGSSWRTLEDSLPNSGAHAWLVPPLDTSQALLRVSSVEGSASDASDGPFTVAPGGTGVTCEDCGGGGGGDGSVKDPPPRSAVGCAAGASGTPLAAAPLASALGLLLAAAAHRRRRSRSSNSGRSARG
jgi:hypothetical protein